MLVYVWIGSEPKGNAMRQFTADMFRHALVDRVWIIWAIRMCYCVSFYCTEFYSWLQMNILGNTGGKLNDSLKCSFYVCCSYRFPSGRRNVCWVRGINEVELHAQSTAHTKQMGIYVFRRTHHHLLQQRQRKSRTTEKHKKYGETRVGREWPERIMAKRNTFYVSSRTGNIVGEFNM